MVFSSFIFLWIFLPVVFIGNFIFRKAGGIRACNIFLLIASIFFYAWGEPVYIFLMLAVILINWAAGFLMDRTKRRKVVLVADVIVNLGLLGVFKYTDMLIGTVNHLTGASLPLRNIALPIGISFYTFQALSYTIDVYRKECEPQKNFLRLALYVSFFPQLIAGPIVKYRDVADQIEDRTMTPALTASGIRRFAYGLGKKVLLSNVLASAVDRIYALPQDQLSPVLIWAASLMYTMQIYYDFSGYSDMAIGLGRMFGFRFMENFNYPYTSLSVREYWRRWHISLSSWFRDYLYFPLGGSRKGLARTCFNLMIVFFLTGLWHGADWNYVLWGLMNGICVVVERLGFDKVLKKNRVFAWICTFFITNAGFVIFRVTDIRLALSYLKRMILPWTWTGAGAAAGRYIDAYTLFTAVLAFAGLGWFQRLAGEKAEKKWKMSAAEIIWCTLIFFFSLVSLSGSTYNPFIYFRF